MVVKVTNGQIWSGTISKNYITGSNIYVENFTLVSKVAQGWYYTALLIELILLISVCSIRIVVIGVCFIRISFTKMPDIQRKVSHRHDE